MRGIRYCTQSTRVLWGWHKQDQTRYQKQTALVNIFFLSASFKRSLDATFRSSVTRLRLRTCCSHNEARKSNLLGWHRQFKFVLISCLQQDIRLEYSFFFLVRCSAKMIIHRFPCARAQLQTVLVWVSTFFCVCFVRLFCSFVKRIAVKVKLGHRHSGVINLYLEKLLRPRPYSNVLLAKNLNLLFDISKYLVT